MKQLISTLSGNKTCLTLFGLASFVAKPIVIVIEEYNTHMPFMHQTFSYTI